MSRKRPFPASIRPVRETESGVSIPAADLRVGEIAVNSADGTVFIKREDGSVVAISGEGGGTGPVGPAGPQGPQGERGFGAFEFTTERVGEEQYKAGEIVYFGGAYYVCLADNDAITPTSAIGVYWDAYSFVGPQGPQGGEGPQGGQGPQGDPGPPGSYDQSLNTGDDVTFAVVSAGAFHAGIGGIHFLDGTVQTTAGGGTSYDQSLNTTDSVAFSGVTTQTLQSGISGPVSVQSDVSIPSHGLTFADGKRQTVACPIYRDWEGTRTYATGDIVVLNAAMYRCISGPYAGGGEPGMDSGWEPISGPPGPAGNPFDQNLNTTDSPTLTALSVGNVNALTGWSSIGFNTNIALNAGAGIVFSDGSTQTTANTGGGASLPDVNSHGYTLLWNPAGSPGWTWSADVWNTQAKVTWAEPAYYYNDVPTLTVSRPSHGATSVTPYGIKFPDGTVQSTAATGGGGGGGGGGGSSWPTTPVEITGTLLSFADVGVGTSLNVLNAASNAGVRIKYHGIYFGDGTFQSSAMPTPWNEGLSSNDNVMLYAGYDGSSNPVWKKTNYGSFGAFFREDSGGAGPGVAFGHGGGNTGAYNWGCVFISAGHGRIYIGVDTEIGAFSVKFPGEVTIANLPTSDPAVAGRLWNDAGTLKVSAGGP